MTTELLIVSLTLIAAGVALLGVALAQRAGRLRRNFFVGIRTLRTLRDDDAWAAAHAGTWIPTLASGLLLSLGGLAALALRPERDEVATALLLVPTGLAAAILLTIGIRGALAARHATRSPDHRS